MKNYEVRSLEKVQIELRQEEGAPPAVRGLGAVYNSTTTIGGSFTEEVMPSAFTKTIQEANIRSCFNHDFNQLLGSTKSGSVSLRSTPEGLEYTTVLPDSDLGSYIHDLLGRGVLDGSSWMGWIVKDSWNDLDNEVPHRKVEEVALLEVGVVAVPAYEDATAGLRSLENAQKEAEDSLKKARDDLAKSRAKRFIRF